MSEPGHELNPLSGVAEGFRFLDRSGRHENKGFFGVIVSGYYFDCETRFTENEEHLFNQFLKECLRLLRRTRKTGDIDLNPVKQYNKLFTRTGSMSRSDCMSAEAERETQIYAVQAYKFESGVYKDAKWDLINEQD